MGLDLSLSFIFGLIFLLPEATFAYKYDNDSTCYARLGCIDDDIATILRPIIKPPVKIEDLSTTFYLYTPGNLEGSFFYAIGCLQRESNGGKSFNDTEAFLPRIYLLWKASDTIFRFCSNLGFHVVSGFSIKLTRGDFSRTSDYVEETIHDADYEVINSKYYDPLEETKIIIHGYMDRGSADWITQMRMAFINRGNNVIVVDWAKGAVDPYEQAVSNSRLVGLELAHVVNSLIEKKGGDPAYFHMVGHGIGAHIAGYSSNNIESLGRITGLDPSGPQFISMPESFRLDPGDAIFVDVIHTDSSLGHGMDKPCGDVDFYPNGGFTKPKPGRLSVPFELIPTTNNSDTSLNASHKLAVEYFTESIVSSPFKQDVVKVKKPSCIFVGFLCESYDEFLKGNCIKCGPDAMGCAMMGIDSDRYPGKYEYPFEPKKFYLNTNDQRPYCGNHYSFKLTVVSPSRDKLEGRLSASVVGDKSIAWEIPLTVKKVRDMKKGKSHTFMGFSKANVGAIKSVELKWKYVAGFREVLECLFCDKSLFISGVEAINFGFNHFNRFEGGATCSEESNKLENGGNKLISLDC